MQRPNNNPIARRDSIFNRPSAQSTRSSTSEFVTSLKLTGATATVTSASATTVATKSVSTPVLRPSITLQPTPKRLGTPPRHDRVDEAGAGARPRTTTTAPPSATTSATTSSAADPPGTTTVIVTGGGDSAFAPPSFRGTDSEDANAWLLRFEKYAVYRGISDADKLHLVAVLLRYAASDWYDNLDNVVKADWTALQNAFKRRFQDTKILRWRKASEL